MRTVEDRKVVKRLEILKERRDGCTEYQKRKEAEQNNQRHAAQKGESAVAANQFSTFVSACHNVHTTTP